MKYAFIKLEEINKQIEETKELGLFYGKMGACIFSYINSQKENTIFSKKMAEQLIDDIYKSINIGMPLGISQGFSGIGLGLHYLTQHSFVEGNLDYVLETVDNLIFQRVAYIKPNSEANLSELCEVLYYLSVRLQYGLKNKTNRKVFTELSIEIINYIYMNRTDIFYEEPYPYTIYYNLVHYLIVTSRFCKMGIYNQRIYNIWKEMRPQVLSRIPYLQANRLWLMYAVQCVSENNKEKDWIEFGHLLASRFSFDELFYKELGNKQIFFSDGLASLYLILNEYNHNSKNAIPIPHQKVYERLLYSDTWSDFEKIDAQSRIGLDGYLGIRLSLCYIKNKIIV